jgi:predicted amidohydrolase
MGCKLKVAVVQMDAVSVPVSKRLDRATNLIAEAVNGGAQFVVLPELFNIGYEFHERNYALAEPIDGKTVTWMKTQAAQHNIHLAGTLLLLDKTDVYNAGLLVAPDGRIWRHDKINIILWERAYFREGRHITIADTDLGKLGLMICSDVLCPDLWVQYAGKVDAMVVMFSPGNTSQADLIFPDGFRMEYADFEKAVTPSNQGSYPGFDVMKQHIAWMRVPMVFAGATGVVRTKLPGLETLLQGSTLSDRASQASEVRLELGFSMATMIGEPKEGRLVHGTTLGDGIVSAEIELADVTPQPLEPQPDVPPFHTNTFDHYVARLMHPLYREGVRRQWGSHMAPD